MTIVLNGDPREVADATLLTDLIAQLQLGRRRFAVEVNEAIVARERIATLVLRPDDRVEIIHFVGGG